MWKIAIILAGVAVAASGAIHLKGGDGANSVSITGNGFSPSTLRIAVGESVTWTNADDRDHGVVADDGSFASPTLKSGASFTYRFKKAGTYGYSCRLHPRETGTVVVE